MIKKIDKDNSLTFQKNYPYFSKKNSIKPYEATLGIGGNLGDVKRRFNHLFIFFQRSSYLDIIATSPILKNPPFGYLEQDDFQNTLIIVKTCLQPKALLRYILGVEKKFGRKRSFPDAPRTLDIDMIFFEKRKMQSKSLTLPHPHWCKRTSVTLPLDYILKHKRVNAK